MYCRWTLFRLEMKRLISMLPSILLETLLFGLIISGVGIYAAKSLYGDKAVGEIKVGIVADSEDRMTGMLVRFVQSMDSLKDSASFVILPEEEAVRQVKEGEIYAAVMVPEGIVDSVISGENLPVTIQLGNSYSRMETEVFAQLTRSGAQLLSVAQAGIYAADTFCLENEMQDQIQQTEDYLNVAYLDYAIGRASVFRTKEVNAVKGVGIVDYYGISLLLAFLSFAGLSFGKCIQVNMGERERLLCIQGISAYGQYVIRAGAFAVVFALLGTIISLPVYLLLIRYTGSSFQVAASWLALFFIWFVIGLFLRMLFQLTGSSPGGIGICFVILMALMFASGVFLPSAFLPLWMEKFGNYFPYKGWMEAAAAVLQGRCEGQIIRKLLIQVIIFLIVGTFLAVLRSCQTGWNIFKKISPGGKNE